MDEKKVMIPSIKDGIENFDISNLKSVIPQDPSTEFKMTESEESLSLIVRKMRENRSKISPRDLN